MYFTGPFLTLHSYKPEVLLSTKRAAWRETDSLGRGGGRSPDRARRPVLSPGPGDPSSPHTPPGCPGGLRRAGEGAGESRALTLARLAACIAMAPVGGRGLPPGRETAAGNGPPPQRAARLSEGPGCYPSLHRAGNDSPPVSMPLRERAGRGT